MTDTVYEVGASGMVTAWHVMPDDDGPEGVLHSHDYRIDVVVARESLDAHGMVCDLDVLRAALDGAIDHVREKNLKIIQFTDAEAVTVEIFAQWAHDWIRAALEPDGFALQVRVWETPEAFGGYASGAS